MEETYRQIEEKEAQAYFRHKERLIEFPQMARKYLGLKEVSPNWDVVYQYYGYKDSYRKGVSRNVVYFEKNTIKKVIHESRHGRSNAPKIKYNEILYHEIDAHIETMDRKKFLVSWLGNKEILVEYVGIGRWGFRDFENDLFIYIDKVYGSSFMKTKDYQSLGQPVKKYSEFECVKSKKGLYSYMQQRLIK